jgi:hypothetical protein
MTKIAKLVGSSFLTRVIVEENASEEEIILETRKKLSSQVQTDLGDCIEFIQDDDECPYNPEND